MNRVHIGNFSGANHLRDVQVTLARSGRADTYGLVGKPNVQRISIRFGIDRYRGDIQLLTRIDDAQGDFTSVGDKDFSKHFRPVEARTHRLLLLPSRPEGKEW